MQKIAIATGGFDPLHEGHINYLAEAKNLGTKLVVGINSDDWLARKKGQPFYSWQVRAAIISKLNMVDEVTAFDDTDGTASSLIEQILTRFPNDEVIFCNGGDRTCTNTPEQIVFGNTPRVSFAFEIGGNTKVNSSSTILQNYKLARTQRPWGYWSVLDSTEDLTLKVKKLVLRPGGCISMQMHQHRSEHWHILSGAAQITIGTYSANYVEGQNVYIPVNAWHRACNTGEKDCVILEVQRGTICREEDILRLSQHIYSNNN